MIVTAQLPALASRDAKREQARVALCDWLRQHGLNPEAIPDDAAIAVDDQDRTITYEVYVRDVRGDPQRHTVTKKLDAAPLPFPAIVMEVAAL